MSSTRPRPGSKGKAGSSASLFEQEVSPRLGVRRCLLRRCPRAIVFIELGDEICVLAVAHGIRAPGYWHTRLQRLLDPDVAGAHGVRRPGLVDDQQRPLVVEVSRQPEQTVHLDAAPKRRRARAQYRQRL